MFQYDTMRNAIFSYKPIWQDLNMSACWGGVALVTASTLLCDSILGGVSMYIEVFAGEMT